MTTNAILADQGLIRIAGFAAVLALMLAWQWRAPFRADAGNRRRWASNFGLVAIDAVVVRLLSPLAGIAAAIVAADQGWGLLGWLGVPGWLAVPIAVVLLDLAIYAQHVATHKVPLLWRLHRVHHTDTGFDATTAVRFHPLEIGLSLAYKVAVVVALGAPAIAVLVFDVLLNAAALFNHGNVRLRGGIERRLRRLIVTPDMHRIHHSVHRPETDSNYGFCLAVWDRLFGTYRAEPRDGHERMRLGLDDFRDRAAQRLDRLLLQPLRRDDRAGRAAGRSSAPPSAQTKSPGEPGLS